MEDFDLIWMALIVVLMAMAWALGRTKRDWWSHALSWMASAALCMFLVRSFYWESFVSQGPSMWPTIPPHSQLTVNKQAYGWVVPALRWNMWSSLPQRQDIVAFRRQEDVWVKRVVALPGDTVAFDAHRGWLVNGQPVAPPSPFSSQWLIHAGLPDDVPVMRQQMLLNITPQWQQYHHFQEVVPSGVVFVLGDNTAASTDSRDIGFVRMDHVLGKVVRWTQGPSS